MKNLLRLILLLSAMTALQGCYDDYTHDFENPNMGFALKKPLRTVVSTDNRIYVGVSIGGKREIDTKGWASFEIDSVLLEGTGMTLLPESYYRLDDSGTFRVRRRNLAIADVGITFTEDFYSDPACLGKHYALPFRLTGTSIRGENSIREGAEWSVVAIKYISGYSGTYYRLGEETETDASGNVLGEPSEYRNKDLSRNITCDLVTKGCNTLMLSAPGELGSSKSILLTVGDNGENGRYPVVIEGENVSNATGTYILAGDWTFYSGDERAPQFELEYTYSADGKYYRVKETLVLRQRPEAELRVETF